MKQITFKMKNALIEIKVTRVMKYTIIAYSAIVVCALTLLIIVLTDNVSVF